MRFLFNGHFTLLSNERLRRAITAIIYALIILGAFEQEASICYRFGFFAEAIGCSLLRELISERALRKVQYRNLT